MKHIDVAMIAANTDRSKVYLQALLQYNICPSLVIIIMDNSDKLLPGQSMNAKINRDTNSIQKIVNDILMNHPSNNGELINGELVCILSGFFITHSTGLSDALFILAGKGVGH